jgi:hypothetical protein
MTGTTADGDRRSSAKSVRTSGGGATTRVRNVSTRGSWAPEGARTD